MDGVCTYRFVGWKGRRSAYVVLLGFVLVIFTWLGVSYLLPGLHSYA
jgi:ABC-type transport system involved in cytochrome c biogenesis permease subunit